MRVNRLIIFSFCIILCLGLLGLHYSLISLNIFCHIAPTILISIWFFNQVKLNLNRLNLIIIFSVFLDSFSYLSMLIAFNYFYGLFSVFTGLILLVVLIYTIRIEGSSFIIITANYYLIILIPFLIIFIIYGLLILPVLTEVPCFLHQFMPSLR